MWPTTWLIVARLKHVSNTLSERSPMGWTTKQVGLGGVGVIVGISAAKVSAPENRAGQSVGSTAAETSLRASFTIPPVERPEAACATERKRSQLCLSRPRINSK